MGQCTIRCGGFSAAGTSRSGAGGTVRIAGHAGCAHLHGLSRSAWLPGLLPGQLRHYSRWLLLGLIGATGIFVGLAMRLFALGLRRYESGNLIGMQA
jgi:hypothetical protein